MLNRNLLFATCQLLKHLHLSVCPGFTVDGSVQESWNETDPGQTVTIKCEKKHVLDGSPERTCNTDVVWTNDPPLCRKLSKLGVECF